MNNPGTILAIGAHYDDIEIGCGGTIALATKKGWKSHILVTTDSAYKSINCVNRSPKQAVQEGMNAAQVLGAELTSLDFEIGNIGWNKYVVKAINSVIDKTRPDVIMTHYSGDTHQDHYYTSMSTISAARFIPNVLMYEPYYPSGRGPIPFNRQLFIDISETIEIKQKAILQHHTQVKRYGPNWIEALHARARSHGFECGCTYAEAFQVLRMLLK
jgi:LmbE family N-acetylglucosaminyl deacetylase